jgi:hypothetical protein
MSRAVLACRVLACSVLAGRVLAYAKLFDALATSPPTPLAALCMFSYDVFLAPHL